jgi:hypothetical protein
VIAAACANVGHRHAWLESKKASNLAILVEQVAVLSATTGRANNLGDWTQRLWK